MPVDELDPIIQVKIYTRAYEVMAARKDPAPEIEHFHDKFIWVKANFPNMAALKVRIVYNNERQIYYVIKTETGNLAIVEERNMNLNKHAEELPEGYFFRFFQRCDN